MGTPPARRVTSPLFPNAALSGQSSTSMFLGSNKDIRSVDELDRFLRERVHRDDILLYGLGVYWREVDESSVPEKAH
jgi:hypothetical protein